MSRHNTIDEERVANLLRVIQKSPCIRTVQGTWAYLDTAASQDAMADLIDIFYPIVLSWNVTTDQQQAAIEAVIHAARTMVVTTTPVGFLINTARQSSFKELKANAPGLIVANTVRWEVSRRLALHHGDASAALSELIADENATITPSTFAAGYRALSAVSTADADGTVPDIADRVVDHHLVHHTLLPALAEPLRNIVLMHYGFVDSVPASLANLLATNGFSVGEQLTDTAISSLLNTTQPTITRRRHKAINQLRDLLSEETDV